MPEIGEHPGDVRGANRRAAVGAHHGVLEAARAGCGIHAADVVVLEQGDGNAEQGGFQEQRDPIAASELEGAVLDDEAAEHGARQEGADDGGEMTCRRKIACRQRRRQHGRGAGQVSDRLMLETEQPDDIDDACHERERPATRQDPRRQFGNHSGAFRSRRALVMTDTELRLIAAPAIIGLSSRPQNG